ncbi:MAG: AAA family ATPase, partial [Candidatus Rokubacteria bacterium]|nr:AAA family ATPase [Candidatus Rokubacteria bacterium]
VNQVMGDGIMALFGAPLAHEDHAVRACYAALDMQVALRRYAEDVRRTHGIEVHIRVGLNSGEVVVRAIGSDLHMDYTAVGQTTHLAARMEQLAPPGSIRLTADTLRLAEGYVEVKPLGPVPVKGLEAPVEVYELVGAGPRRSRLQAAAARGLTRFVGREAEIEQIRQALTRAAARQGQVVAVVGEPGVGKSRLVWEVTRSHRAHGWLILEAGSVSYGKATPYLPVIDLLKAYFQLEARDEQRKIREKVTGKLLALDRVLEPTLPAVLSLLDVPVEDPQWETLNPPGRRQRMLEAVKRVLFRESQVQPLLLVFEDLHWIDSETQALLDSLVESLPTARILLLVNYRPEYEHRWGSKTYYAQLRLDPLPAESAEELLRALLGTDPGLEPLKQILIARTEGNPFFLEESVRTLAETQVLVGARGAYHLAQALPSIQVPATVQAVLAARIDRLPPEAKAVLQTAAVIGHTVRYRLLATIAELPEEQLRRSCTQLQAAEFIYEASLFPDLEYTFKHALTREVAYSSLLSARRQALHAAAGQALESFYPEEKPYGILAYHYQAAGELAKALTYHGQAADAARQLYAGQEALEQYTGALDVATLLKLPLADRAVYVFHLKRGEVYAQSGDISRARADFEAAWRGAQLAGDQAIEMQALNELGFLLAGAADYRAAIPYLEAALRIANALDDRAGQVSVLSRLSIVYTNRLELDRALDYAQLGLRLARELGSTRPLAIAMDSWLIVAVMIGDFKANDEISRQLIEIHRSHGDLWYLQFALIQSCYVPMGAGGWHEALARVEEALAVNRRIGDRGNEPMHLAFQCWIHRSRGEYARALAAGRQAVNLAQELGHAEWVAWGETFVGWTLYEVYALDEAVQHLQRGYEAAERAGALIHAVNGVGHLAWARWLRGDAEEALASVERAEALMRQITTPPGTAFVLGAPAYAAVARVHLARGEAGRADRLLSPILAAAQSCGWKEAIAQTSLVIGECRAACAEPEAAQTALRLALDVALKVGLPGVAWEAHAALAALCQAEGRLTEAEDHFVAGKAIVQRLAAGLDDETVRRGFLNAALSTLEAR